MNQARPRIVARLREHEEAVAAAEAALEEGLVMLPLVNTPDEADGTHELHIHLLGAPRPVVVLADVAGAPSDSLFPLILRPLEGDGRGKIRAFLLEISQRTKNFRQPAEAAPAIARRAAPTVSSVHAEPVVLGGKYRLGQPLRAGASVYAAVQAGLEKTLAVKVLRPHGALPPDLVVSFQRQALAASELDHPNVVRVLDFGHERGGPLFIVMDLLTGGDLRSVLRDEATLPLERIVGIVAQVSAALAVAHERGVVHRDVKPANVFLLAGTDDDGHPMERALVADFGIAEIVGSLRCLDPSFDPIMASGTPHYMSPEQARGERPDHRSDLYACGVMLYEMATGRLPFAAPSSAAEMLRLQTSPPAPSTVAPSIDKRLERIIVKAMSKDPSARYESARELRADLRALVGAARSEVSVAPPAAMPRAAVAAPAARWARPSAAPPTSPRVSDFPPLASTISSRPPPSVPPFARLAEPDLEETLGTAAAARAARASREDEGFEIPMSSQAVDRSDALDIDFGQLREATGLEDVRNQPAWVALELMTNSLRTDPEAVLGPLDRIADVAEYASEMQRLDKPIATLASRGEAGALMRVLSSLQKRAVGEPPGETSKRGAAALRVALLSRQRDSLAPIARVAIDGPVGERASAFALIAACGAAGAHAACAGRKRPPEPNEEDRARFVALIRDIGVHAVVPVGEALKTPSDRHFVEDCLDGLASINGGAGLPPTGDLTTSATLADLLSNDAVSIRKRAVAAFSSVLGARAHARLMPLLKTDTDESVRIAVVEALRRSGGIGRDAVLQLDAFLNGPSPVGVELRVAAAAALGRADASARPQAAGVLARALKPPQQGLLNKLVSGDADDPLFMTTLAKSFLAIGGADAATLIEARAAKSSAEVKRQLLELCQRRA